MKLGPYLIAVPMIVAGCRTAGSGSTVKDDVFAGGSVKYEYDCKDTDVLFLVSPDTKQIYVMNTECGSRMSLASEAGQKSTFRYAAANDSDALCGTSATVDGALFTGQNAVGFKLSGGESAGTYQCQNNPQGGFLPQAHAGPSGS